MGVMNENKDGIAEKGYTGLVWQVIYCFRLFRCTVFNFSAITLHGFVNYNIGRNLSTAFALAHMAQKCVLPTNGLAGCHY